MNLQLDRLAVRNFLQLQHRNVIYTQHGTHIKKRAITNIQIQHANTYIYVQPVQKRNTFPSCKQSKQAASHTHFKDSRVPAGIIEHLRFEVCLA